MNMAAIHHPHVTYLDYDEMLADPHVEAVIVATADQFHASMASQALAARETRAGGKTAWGQR